VGAHQADSRSSRRFLGIPGTFIVGGAVMCLTENFTRRTQSYLAELINERRFSNDKDEKRDLLSNLVSANEELSGDGEQRLGEEELIGTCFALR
jgi:hypothetical protein